MLHMIRPGEEEDRVQPQLQTEHQKQKELLQQDIEAITTSVSIKVARALNLVNPNRTLARSIVSSALTLGDKLDEFSLSINANTDIF